jgi:hypothetical protein
MAALCRERVANVGTFGFTRENEFDALIWQYAGAYGLNPLLVKAIIATESGFNPQAFRPEPRIGDASRGLMQVLFKTAVWMGYRGDPEGLFDPATSIRYGTAYLNYQWARYAGSAAQQTDAIAAYNAGTAFKTQDPAGRLTYKNQDYVTKVLHYLAGYQAAQVQPPNDSVPIAEVLREQPPEAAPDAAPEAEKSWWDVAWESVFGPSEPAPVPEAAPGGALGVLFGAEEGAAPEPVLFVDPFSPGPANGAGAPFPTWLLVGGVVVVGVTVLATGRG